MSLILFDIFKEDNNASSKKGENKENGRY